VAETVLAECDDDPHDPTAAIVRTSGSTGTPKAVLLQASALLASASAAHDQLGGPGTWVLALPCSSVAGLMVLVRSLVAQTPPEVCDLSQGFVPASFAAAVKRCRSPRRYTALVPTQLRRLLDADGTAVEALQALDAVLVGGAALPPRLRERAAQAGVRVVSTYGMTETCGGCVYDGTPLDGVDVRVGASGRVSLGGPVVARGYLAEPLSLKDHVSHAEHVSLATLMRAEQVGPAERASAFSLGADGVRWFTTADAGTWDGQRLDVHGRLDDVVVTGGVNVAPLAVENALQALTGVEQAVVVGVPDEEWGYRVVAAVVAEPGGTPPSLSETREHVRHVVGPAAAPRQLIVLSSMPLLATGKPDRGAVLRLAEGR
jgi:O-succinylbenzoic acid--CoA ligase